MGVPMARNLAKAGFELASPRAPPRRPRRSRPSSRRQARVAGRRRPARCEIVVSCLPDAPEVEEVHLGEQRDRPRRRTRDRRRRLLDDRGRGGPLDRGPAGEGRRALLDAPVSGGQKGAAEGTLTFFVGGEGRRSRRRGPVLAAMGKRITLLGGAGAGQLGKATNQIVVAGNLVAVSEASRSREGGPAHRALHGALTGGAATSWTLEVLGRKMIDRDFKPAFAIRHQQKDLAIVLQTARAERRAAAGRSRSPPAALLARGAGARRGWDAGAAHGVRADLAAAAPKR